MHIPAVHGNCNAIWIPANDGTYTYWQDQVLVPMPRPLDQSDLKSLRVCLIICIGRQQRKQKKNSGFRVSDRCSQRLHRGVVSADNVCPPPSVSGDLAGGWQHPLGCLTEEREHAEDPGLHWSRKQQQKLGHLEG